MSTASAAASAAAARASTIANVATLPLPATAQQARNDPRAAPIAMMASFAGMMLGYIMHGVMFSIKESEFDNLPATAHHLATTTFWLASGSRMGVIVPMLVPLGCAYWLGIPSKKAEPKMALHATVTLRTRYRYALRVQGAGNLLGCVVLKLFADEWHLLNSAVPIQRSNGAWMVCCVCSSLLFTFGAFCVQLSRQKRALRWLLLVPLLQSVWSLTHDLEWMLGYYAGPAQDMAGFGLVHALLVWPLLAIQLHHFFAAEATAPAEGDEASAADADSPVFVRKRVPAADRAGARGAQPAAGGAAAGGGGSSKGADTGASAAALSRQASAGVTALMSRAAASASSAAAAAAAHAHKPTGAQPTAVAGEAGGAPNGKAPPVAGGPPASAAAPLNGAAARSTAGGNTTPTGGGKPGGGVPMV